MKWLQAVRVERPACMGNSCSNRPINTTGVHTFSRESAEVINKNEENTKIKHNSIQTTLAHQAAHHHSHEWRYRRKQTNKVSAQHVTLFIHIKFVLVSDIFVFSKTY